jgi:hypothetical protein
MTGDQTNETRRQLAPLATLLAWSSTLVCRHMTAARCAKMHTGHAAFGGLDLSEVSRAVDGGASAW